MVLQAFNPLEQLEPYEGIALRKILGAEDDLNQEEKMKQLTQGLLYGIDPFLLNLSDS